MTQAPPQLPPWRVYPRPAGDFAVQRLQGGLIVRYGTRKTRSSADRLAVAANLLNAGPSTIREVR